MNKNGPIADILQQVITTVNYIKPHPLHARLFATLWIWKRTISHRGGGREVTCWSGFSGLETNCWRFPWMLKNCFLRLSFCLFIKLAPAFDYEQRSSYPPKTQTLNQHVSWHLWLSHGLCPHTHLLMVTRSQETETYAWINFPPFWILSKTLNSLRILQFFDPDKNPFVHNIYGKFITLQY